MQHDSSRDEIWIRSSVNKTNSYIVPPPASCGVSVVETGEIRLYDPHYKYGCLVAKFDL